MNTGIPQMSPTNVLLTTITIQTVMVYLPNVLNNVKCSAPKKTNNILTTENRFNW